jgi:hypothetical protein
VCGALRASLTPEFLRSASLFAESEGNGPETGMAEQAERPDYGQLVAQLEAKKKWRQERMVKAKTLSPAEWREVAETNRAIELLEKQIRELREKNPKR